MPNKPDVRVNQEVDDSDIQVQEAELPLCLIGPLYQVVDGEVAGNSFEPLEVGDQEFEWPELKLGAVVDLAGTRNGYIDSQRKELADFPPEFFLTEGQSRHQVDDGYIKGLDQNSFEIEQEARNGLQRATVEGFVVNLDGEDFVYNPDGGFLDLEEGDKFEFGGNEYTVESLTSTRIYTQEVLDTTPYDVEIESNSVDIINVSPHSSLSGRLVVDGPPDTFLGVDVDDFAVTYLPVPGMSTENAVPTPTLEQEDVVTDVVFDIPVSDDDIEDKLLRVENITTGEYHFVESVSSDLENDQITLESGVGSIDDEVKVEILKAQKGYVESKNNDSSEIVVVAPETFSDSVTAVHVRKEENKESFDVFPVFDVEVKYRALRQDVSGDLMRAQRTSQLLNEINEESVHHKDGLGFAVNIATSAQPEGRAVFFIPVDTEPNSSTGLTENQDLHAGYSFALEDAEADQRLYNMVLMDNSATLRAYLHDHVSNMSTKEEGAWRRGFVYRNIPYGEFESESGVIQPGEAPGGTVTGSNDGNKVIKDEDINFVTDAEVEEGTEVVVTFPEEFAGEYQALGSTTDDHLVLDGEEWDREKEFHVTSMDVNTSGGVHEFSGAEMDTFVHVEEGDYVEATIDGVTYRLKVVSVRADGTGFAAEDEASGSPEWSNETAEDVSVIRTWRTVDYHINPLSKAEQAEELVARKSIVDRRMTVMLNYSPLMEVGVDEDGNTIEEYLDPALSMVAVAAKRSGSTSYEEVTNLFLGAGIEDVEYGYNHFKRSHLKTLSDAGFMLLEQDDENAQPYIRDMITSDTTSIVTQEEIVTANADWQSKTLQTTYQTPRGSRFKILNDRLMGVRSIQADAILKSWVNSGRLIRFRNLEVGRNEGNQRQTDIGYVGVFPLAEKEIEFTIEITV